MRKSLSKNKNPTRTIQMGGQEITYNISQTKCLTTMENTSSGTSSTQKCQRFSRKTNRYQILRKQHKNFKQINLAELLRQMVERRKRYSFQMVKLLYMFPDDTFSESVSVNSYDRLFFHEEHVHTMVKIYETKEMQAKIWAFLNLKNLHLKKKLEKFTTKIEKVHKKYAFQQQKITFDMIHQYSIKIKPQVKIATPIIIQRKQPIQTTVVQTRKPYQPVKSERTQKNINNFSKIETNQVIRISASQSSPLIRRIELGPSDVKVIYPSRIINSNENSRNITQKSTYQVKRESSNSRINVISPSKNISYVKEQTHAYYPTKTVIEGERIQYHRPSRVQYDTSHTVRRIQPAQSTVVYSKPTQVRQIRQVNRNYSQSGHLVHTVHGDCIINVHNGCNHGEEANKAQVIQTSRDKTYSNNSYPSINQHLPMQSHQHLDHHHSCCNIKKQYIQPNCHCYNHSYSYSHSNCCSPSHCHNINNQSCHSHHTSHCCASTNNSYPSYSLEQRIQYMKHLQHLADKINSFKLNKFAKDAY